MQYAEEASKYCRKELAMKCCQKAYALSSKYIEMKQISKLIETLCTAKDLGDEVSGIEEDEGEISYLKRFFRQIYCADLSEKVKDNIEISYIEE